MVRSRSKDNLMSEIVKAVIPITSEIHAETFASALGASVLKEPEVGEGIRWAFFVGGSPNPLFKKFKDSGYKTAVFWIGSDSMTALQQIAYRKTIDNYDVHICLHKRIQDELASWKINSHVVWPCARNVSDGLGSVSAKLVGVYMPEPSLYMFEECKQVALENPDLPFVFYGALFPMGDLPANVQDAGRMKPEETADIINKMSVMVRLVRHDGNPVGGIEARQRGINVIENFPYDGFMYAKTIEEVNKLLRDPQTHEIDNGPWPYLYRAKCGKEFFKREIERILCASGS